MGGSDEGAGISSVDLLEQAEVVDERPVLRQPPVGDAEVVHHGTVYPLFGGGLAHELAGLAADHAQPHEDPVALGNDVDVQFNLG